MVALATYCQPRRTPTGGFRQAWLISVGGFAAAPGAVRGPFQIMDVIGLPLVSGIMAYWGGVLGEEQMVANGAFVKVGSLPRSLSRTRRL